MKRCLLCYALPTICPVRQQIRCTEMFGRQYAELRWRMSAPKRCAGKLRGTEIGYVCTREEGLGPVSAIGIVMLGAT
eukprot:3246314-Rhodomonas_salina.1